MFTRLSCLVAVVAMASVAPLNAQEPKKEPAKGGADVGVIKSIDLDKKQVTIEIALRHNKGTMATHTLADAVTVMRLFSKDEVKLSDLAAGDRIILTLDRVSMKVTQITVGPAKVRSSAARSAHKGTFKSIDADKKTIMIEIGESRFGGAVGGKPRRSLIRSATPSYSVWDSRERTVQVDRSHPRRSAFIDAGSRVEEGNANCRDSG